MPLHLTKQTSYFQLPTSFPTYNIDQITTSRPHKATSKPSTRQARISLPPPLPSALQPFFARHIGNVCFQLPPITNSRSPPNKETLIAACSRLSSQQLSQLAGLKRFLLFAVFHRLIALSACCPSTLLPLPPIRQH